MIPGVKMHKHMYHRLTQTHVHTTHACKHDIQTLCLVISLVCRYSSEIMEWKSSVAGKIRSGDSGGLVIVYCYLCFYLMTFAAMWCVNCVLFDQYHTAFNVMC